MVVEEYVCLEIVFKAAEIDIRRATGGKGIIDDPYLAV